MGRRKKDREESEPHLIALRVSDLEYDIIQNRAETLNISASEYIRKAIFDSKIEFRYDVVADMTELQKIASDIGKIGSNLNQIAKYFNMGGIRSKAMQDDIHECIVQLSDMRQVLKEMAGDYHGDYQTHRN